MTGRDDSRSRTRHAAAVTFAAYNKLLSIKFACRQFRFLFKFFFSNEHTTRNLDLSQYSQLFVCLCSIIVTFLLTVNAPWRLSPPMTTSFRFPVEEEHSIMISISRVTRGYVRCFTISLRQFIPFRYFNFNFQGITLRNAYSRQYVWRVARS